MGIGQAAGKGTRLAPRAMAGGRNRHAWWLATLLSPWLWTVPPARAATEDGAAAIKTLDGFAAVRQEVLAAIGSATQRIWLTTPYLTDGEIASALFVAKYRKLDVQVLLGRTRANHYMSRLSYLKNQSIPVFLKPDGDQGGKLGPRSGILCDEMLLSLDGDLDFLAHVQRYTLSRGRPADVAAFQGAFTAAIAQKLPAVPQPLPMVGHPGGRDGKAAPTTAAPAPAKFLRLPTATPHAPTEEGVYTYTRRPEPRPDGVPAKLPKELKWERSQRANDAQKDEDPVAASSSPGPIPPPPRPDPASFVDPYAEPQKDGG